MCKSIDECIELAKKREMPFLDVEQLEWLREKESVEWARNAYTDEIAFSQEWFDSRLSKPEFAKNRRHRAAMKAEKTKRASGLEA